MKFYCNLYLDENVSANKFEIIEKLKNSEWQLELYIIALSQNPHNHLEIYNSALLLQKSFYKRQQMIVGITRGYNEALELVEKIMKEVYDNTKGTDIKTYIIEKQRIFEEGNK